MKRMIRTSAAAVALSLAAVAGCESSGLSPREEGNRTVSTYLMSLYETPLGSSLNAASSAAAAAQPARLTLPTKVAVAQIGDLAPPSSVLAKLEAKPGLFTRVEGIPSTFAGHAGHDAYRGGGGGDAQRASEEMQQMRRMALDMGMDHLLLIGGTIDHATQSTGLAAANLTIIGAFVVPSQSIEAEAKATAALIDLRTNRVVLTASADAKRSKLAASAAQEEGRLNVLRGIRDNVLQKVADNFVQECERRAAACQAAPAAADGDSGAAVR